jgi:signal transduction histidine kinase
MNATLVLMVAGAAASGGLAMMLYSVLRRRRDVYEVFNELPTGVCALAHGQVLHWNLELERLSGVTREQAVGTAVWALPDPWSRALGEAHRAPPGRVAKQAIDGGGVDGPRWVMLHSGATTADDHQLILVEDISDYQMLQDELLHRERLAAIGRLAAGVAHEIGNPVTGIACVAQNLREDMAPGDAALAAEEILKQTARVSRTLTALMQLSHPGSAEHEARCVPCNLADCVDEASHLLGLDADAPVCVMENRCDRELLVRADAQLLLQVFINLLDNARSAGHPGPVVVSAHSDGATVAITVDNPGEAIPAEVLEQVFEPFYTTKDVGEGTGLGLPLVRSMLEDMDGRIELLSPSPAYGDSGARACVTLATARYDAATTGSP